MSSLALLSNAPNVVEFSTSRLHRASAPEFQDKWQSVASSRSSDREMPETESSKGSLRQTFKGDYQLKESKPSPPVKQERSSSDSSDSNIPDHSSPHSPQLSSPKTSSCFTPCVSPSSPSKTPLSTSSASHPNFTQKRLGPCFPPMMGGLGPAIGGIAGPLGFFNNPQAVLPEGVRSLAATTMPRNCSDLIRSMAAKYNNTNSSINPKLVRPAAVQQKTFTAVSSPSKGGENCITKTTLAKEVDKKSISQLHRIDHPPGILPVHSIPPHLLPSGAFPGLPTPSSIMDFSSTQVLLNMVRNASTFQQSSFNKMELEKAIHHLPKQGIHEHLIQQQAISKKYINSKTFSNETSLSENADSYDKFSTKRPLESSSPLDLSSTVPSKYRRIDSFTTRRNSYNHQDSSDIDVEDEDSNLPPDGLRNSPTNSPTPNKVVAGLADIKNFSTWTVDEVYEFVKSIDICAEYAERFRDQRIDGACLSLLSESHLTESLKMKLGPALKLRSFLLAKTPDQLHPHSPSSNSCSHCVVHNNNNNHLNKSFSSDSPDNHPLVSPPSLSSSVMSSVAISLTGRCLSPSHPQSKENGFTASVDCGSRIERQSTNSSP